MELKHASELKMIAYQSLEELHPEMVDMFDDYWQEYLTQKEQSTDQHKPMEEHFLGSGLWVSINELGQDPLVMRIIIDTTVACATSLLQKGVREAVGFVVSKVKERLKSKDPQ